jgi:hypothetical protein|tara:strand:+ start:3636 stop:5288 length:1653 start_codon:yes stop_codon:yes gene_type:complete
MIKEKLNPTFISQYKTVFSEQLIAQAFKEKEMLTGKEILYISPIKQLNLFIIKSLFERWQEEIKRIESPYFDYHAPEVKVMISKFMNVLSQNISINAENLKPIIEKAVDDLIVLNFDPASYLDNEIKKRPELLFNKKFIPQFAKYLVFHKSLILDFLDVFETHDLKHLKRYAIAFFEKHTLGEYELVQQLSEILILEKQELFESIQSIKKSNENNLIVRELPSEQIEVESQTQETIPQMDRTEDRSGPKDNDSPSEVVIEKSASETESPGPDDVEMASTVQDDPEAEMEEDPPSPDNEDLVAPSTSSDQSPSGQPDDKEALSEITTDPTDDLPLEESVEEVGPMEASSSNESSSSTEEKDSTKNNDYENEELERSTSDFSLETEGDVSMDKFQTLDEIDKDNGTEDELNDFPLEDPIIEVYKNKKDKTGTSEPLGDDLSYRKEPELSKLNFETINEQFESETKTIADAHQEERITSILSNISINHQYMFVKELFGDSDKKFKATITKIERLENFDAAVEYLIRNDAKEYQWDMSAEIVKELLKIIFRRFR